MDDYYYCNKLLCSENRIKKTIENGFDPIFSINPNGFVALIAHPQLYWKSSRVLENWKLLRMEMFSQKPSQVSFECLDVRLFHFND